MRTPSLIDAGMYRKSPFSPQNGGGKAGKRGSGSLQQVAEPRFSQEQSLNTSKNFEDSLMMDSVHFDAVDFKRKVAASGIRNGQNTALNFAPQALSTGYRHQISNQTRGVTMRDTVSVLGSEKYRGTISMNGNAAELFTGVGDYLQLNRAR